MLKAQINVEFILSISIFLSVILFVSVSVANTLPAFHIEASKQTIRSKSFQVSHVLSSDEGIWGGMSIEQISRLGLSAGGPNVIDENKAAVLDNCNSTEYDTIKKLLSISETRNLIINITEINFTGGPDKNVSQCTPPAISLIATKFWVKRILIMTNGTDEKIVRLSVSVY